MICVAEVNLSGCVADGQEGCFALVAPLARGHVNPIVLFAQYCDNYP